MAGRPEGRDRDMAKRFTATEKWSDKWFRKLSPTLKLGWLYLTDNCDASGVIELDEEHAEFQIGTAVDWDDLFKVAESRIKKLGDGKWWLTKFLAFQYGKLSWACPAHRPAIQAIEKNGLSRYLSNSFRKAIGKQLVNNGMVISSSSSSEGGCKGETADALFERFWKSYPSQRRGGRKTCRKAWDAALRDVDAETLIAAAVEYADSPVGRGQFAKSPAAWLNGGHWTDDRLAWQHADRQSHAREITPAMLGIDEQEEHPF